VENTYTINGPDQVSTGNDGYIRQAELGDNSPVRIDADVNKSTKQYLTNYLIVPFQQPENSRATSSLLRLR
jgi:hypothetical protein